jgi:hypothetical protein
VIGDELSRTHARSLEPKTPYYKLTLLLLSFLLSVPILSGSNKNAQSLKVKISKFSQFFGMLPFWI